MAKINKYCYQDPNAGNLTRCAEGDSYNISPLGICFSGLAIRIFDGTNQVLYSCYRNGSLTISSLIGYDCLNGECVSKTIYNTPGIYTSLEECELSCGSPSSDPCDGVCISNADWAAIQGLAEQLKNKNCS